MTHTSWQEQLEALQLRHDAGEDVLAAAERLHAASGEIAAAVPVLDDRQRRLALRLSRTLALGPVDLDLPPSLRQVAALWSGEVLTPTLRAEVDSALAEAAHRAAQAGSRRDTLADQVALARARLATLSELTRLLDTLRAAPTPSTLEGS